MSQCFIKYNILRIPSNFKDQVVEFYTKVCGMILTTETYQSYVRHILSFKSTSFYHPTGICFECAPDIKTNIKDPGFWKVGFALHDVDAAVLFLCEKAGSIVSDGIQFEDIGYSTFLQDPSGCSIELLQHSFKENFVRLDSKRTILNQPISLPPVLGQITIRCKDPVRTCAFYTEVLGMKLLSIQQPGNKYPFSLYFFAYTNENPPNRDNLHAIENREWLWKQPYTQIEFQHRHGTENMPSFSYTTNDVGGHGKITHGGFHVVVSKDILDHIKTKCNILGDNSEFTVQDPDGYSIEISCA